MLKTTLPVEVLEDAVRLACRAPSYRNSQPWNWMIDHSQVGATRDIVADVVGRALPQVIVRIGSLCNQDLVPPRAPRRPLSDVLHFAE